jgi:hypothetical protein
MQNQPHLLDLGLARIELLKAFTIASLEQQTSQNYLWVIRTDPNLDVSLRRSLIEALKDHDHHLLIASNENLNIQVHHLTTVDPNSVWSGDLSYATSYLLQKPRENIGARMVLESRLDADDGLHLKFVETIQTHAKALLSSREDHSWRIWCASRHVEWQYHEAWKTEVKSPLVGGLFSLRDVGCISAGLTIGYIEGLKVHDLPPMRHDQMRNLVPSCDKKRKTRCLDFVNLLPTALRARTPTSAGMLNIMLKEKGTADRQYEKGALHQKHVQEKLWKLIGQKFGFLPETAARLHDYLKANMQSIAADNLEGQCTDGHSCKNSSKILLQTIIDRPESIR